MECTCVLDNCNCNVVYMCMIVMNQMDVQYLCMRMLYIYQSPFDNDEGRRRYYDWLWSRVLGPAAACNISAELT